MHGRSYRVKPGDSLSSIAQRQLGKASFWPRIFVHNNRSWSVSRRIADPDMLQVGQVIELPPSEPPSHPRTHHALQSGARHRQQLTRPSIMALTRPAATTPAAPARRAAPAQILAATGSSQTRINSFPIKYSLDLIPEQSFEGPNFEASLKFQGSIVIWADTQLPVLTFTDKGAELAAKRETDAVLGKLLGQTKISWDEKAKKVSFEDLPTTQAKGMPPSVTAVGVAADSSNPIPALRAKFVSAQLQGRLLRHLFIAENMTVIIDIRPRGGDDDITRRPNPGVAVRPAPAPARQHWYDSTVSFLDRNGRVIEAGVLVLGAAVVVTAAVGSNFVTFGADTPVDVPAAALAGAMVGQAATIIR